MTTSNNKKNKDSVDSNFTFILAAYPEVPDMKPGSSGSGREAERQQPNDESSSISSAQSHYDHHQCFVAMSED
jgi:hypothetical protein